jgi:hypothetical protein
MSKQLGIWMDFRVAEIIARPTEESIPVLIASEIEEVQPGGGSRSRVPYGPMDKKSDRKILQRRKNQIDHYFQQIVDEVKSADEIFIFGPGEAKSLFLQYIRELKSFEPYILSIITEDRMTTNQKSAYVRSFYESLE